MKKLSLLPILAITLSACSVIQKNSTNIVLDEVTVESPTIAERAYYHEAPQRLNDLVHTKLAVSFNWEKKHLLGTALLDLKPYFNPQSILVLDAKGFDIHELALVDAKGNKTPLNYEYDRLLLTINLGREYTREESYQIFIAYTAKPDELNVEGSTAITDAKGLYFINADGSEDKPMQIWTQGEPESNSSWFPTIDKPNERMTQEIAITVAEKFTSLSNGLMISSTENNNGTRTDVWKQSLEHAPYLAMMAIGEFSITKDSWRDLEVNYYVEPKEEKHAQRIFGKTPAMMTFYSEILGFDYPWEKYSQIIVRDYVSGAMENTTGVIHGEFVYSDEREFIDDPNEMIIAHELFHHWFGDWVTCESWPNLPLNEAFATYGEYLWMEGKYSADEAAHYLHDDLLSYMRESSRKQEDLIRFDNENPGNMFDSHTYAKGGRILHMLRYHLGDDAFFTGLEYYLTEYANQAVEVHQLRLAMEKVSGEDLNWFFNQWFLAAGHPTLSIQQELNDNRVKLTIAQEQSLETTPLYKLPLAIEVYVNGKAERHLIELNKQVQEFEFEVSQKADLVVFDADHYLLADISYPKSDDEWVYQLQNAAHYYDRLEALDSLVQSENFAMKSRGIKMGLFDEFWAIKTQALDNFEHVDAKIQGTLESQLMILAEKDEKSDVRGRALYALSLHFDQKEVPARSHIELYTKMVKDPSYLVAGEALKALAFENIDAAYVLAKEEMSSANKELKTAVFNTIAKAGKIEDLDLIQNEFKAADGYDILGASYNLLSFLKIQKEGIYLEPLNEMSLRFKSFEQWYMRYYALDMLKKHITQSEGDFKLAVRKIYENLLAEEKDERVLQYLGLK